MTCADFSVSLYSQTHATIDAHSRGASTLNAQRRPPVKMSATRQTPFRAHLWRQAFAGAVLLLLSVAAPVSAEGFSIEQYRELEAQMHDSDVRRVATEPDTVERERAVGESLRIRREIIRFLSDWLDSGTMDETLSGHAREARLVLIENVVQLNIEVGECREAERSASLIRDFAESGNEEYERAWASAQRGIAECVPATEGSAAQSDSGELQPNIISPVVPQEPPDDTRRKVGWGLLGGGLALAAGGGIWNFSLLDERAEHRDLVDADVPQADAVRFAELSDTLDSAKIPVALLVGGGLAMAATGAIMVALPVRDRNNVAPTEVGIDLSTAYVGVRLRTTFGNLAHVRGGDR